MIKRIFVVFIILISVQALSAKSYKNTTISLLTVSPGTELYSLFGHSAIRVLQPLEGKDLVYNYGTFNFDTPNFGFLFVRGRLNYMLSVGTFSQIYQSSIWEERALTEQILNLSDDQKERIVTFLENNALPENCYYRYDFLKDNCSTRLRDVVELGLKDTSIFDRASMSYPPLSYRQLLAPYLSNFPWVHFGIDLALGLPADKITDNNEKMFLPDYMMAILTKTKLINGQNLVESQRTILTQMGAAEQTINILTPLSVFFALLTLSLIGFSSSYFSRVYCSVFYFLLGLLGVVITFLWFGTDHSAMKNNLNLLWAFPFNIIMFRAAGKKFISKFSRFYFIGVGSVALLLLAMWTILPQQYNSAIIPLLITILITSIQISIQRYKPNDLKRGEKKLKRVQ